MESKPTSLVPYALAFSFPSHAVNCKGSEREVRRSDPDIDGELKSIAIEELDDREEEGKFKSAVFEIWLATIATQLSLADTAAVAAEEDELGSRELEVEVKEIAREESAGKLEGRAPHMHEFAREEEFEQLQLQLSEQNANEAKGCGSGGRGSQASNSRCSICMSASKLTEGGSSLRSTVQIVSLCAPP